MISTYRLLRSLKSHPRLWDGTIIVSWFWLVGAVVLSLLPVVVKKSVGGTEGVVTLCLTVFAIGIATGSLLAAQLSHERPNVALVPLGSIVMGLIGFDLAWTIGHLTPADGIHPLQFVASLNGLRMLFDFFIFAVGGGLFVVPAFAAVQAWSAPAERARVIAAGNVMSAAFMVVASLVVALLQAIGVTVAWLFLCLGGSQPAHDVVRDDEVGQRKAFAISARSCSKRSSALKYEGSKTCLQPARGC